MRDELVRWRVGGRERVFFCLGDKIKWLGIGERGLSLIIDFCGLSFLVIFFWINIDY